MFLIDRLQRFATDTPDAVAVRFEAEAISYKELSTRVGLAQAVLTDKFGVKPGDRVSYLGLNHPDMLTMVFACAEMGAIFNPLNSRLVAEEYRYLIGDSEPTVCLFGPAFAATASELSDSPCRFAPLSALSVDDDLGDGLSVPREPSTDSSLVGDDPLLLVYTTGTTSRAKGVILSHAAVQANIENCDGQFGFGSESRVQVSIPLFHVGGLCILSLPALTHGSTLYLHERFDPTETLEQIEREEITIAVWVPAQMGAMMALPQWSLTDLSSLDCVVVGSSNVPLPQIQKLHSRNIPASQIYGATETGPAAIGLKIDAAMSHAGSVGTPVNHAKVQIRDSNRNEVPVGTRGEIWVNGPNLLTGYWRNETETAKILVDQWYNTEDIGYVDEEGYYWVVDRSKDVIISGGENIYPAEIEAACSQHPAVASVTVVGKHHDRWGETPVAVVELTEGTRLTLTELNTFIGNKVASYKQPTLLVIYDELPRNTMGKVDKTKLRKQIANP